MDKLLILIVLLILVDMLFDSYFFSKILRTQKAQNVNNVNPPVYAFSFNQMAILLHNHDLWQLFASCEVEEEVYLLSARGFEAALEQAKELTPEQKLSMTREFYRMSANLPSASTPSVDHRAHF